MTSQEIRKRFLAFFEKRGHAIIPSASLVPENDPSVLFNTAGMQPLVPYLLGEKHPQGTRLADVQKCVRTVDIDEIGDNTHATFFEMLGNWSLGDYFKKEAINWSFELLTSQEEGFGLDPKRLYVTCFEGDENAPRDEESAAIWKEIFEKNNIEGNRIFFLPAKNNWWSPGDNGPCGPDTEMFYDVTGELTKGLTHEEFLKADDEQKVVEIWNDVFMEYVKKDGKVTGKLAQQNVDTGSGLERVTMVIQGKDNIFDIDIFEKPKAILAKQLKNQKDTRIVLDHIRTATMLMSDGVLPSNTDQGYVLRRLVRRAAFKMYIAGITDIAWVKELVEAFTAEYGGVYASVQTQQSTSIEELQKEIQKFYTVVASGVKMLDKVAQRGEGKILGEEVFVLVTTHGLPLELVTEIAKEKSLEVDIEGFNVKFEKHKSLSRKGAEGKFKGGLAGTGEMETKYHTATHLLNAGLRKVLGDHVSQKGSNITAERLRFDFAHPEKMTDEQKKEVEDFVNEQIKKDLPVVCEEMPIEKARELNAIGVFGDKYGEVVKVYIVGDKDNPVSMELCGGPHVEHTGLLGHFSIKKEEASSAGVRRIKAVLE